MCITAHWKVPIKREKVIQEIIKKANTWNTDKNVTRHHWDRILTWQEQKRLILSSSASLPQSVAALAVVWRISDSETSDGRQGSVRPQTIFLSVVNAVAWSFYGPNQPLLKVTKSVKVSAGSKSKEIVFTKPRSCQQTDLPPPIVGGFERVQHILVLGVTLTYNLTMTTHIDNIITSCARVLYGLRTLRCLLLCTLCSSLLHWPRLHMLLQPGGVSPTPQIGVALRPLSVVQLSMATAQTLHQLSPRSVIKPIRHCLLT